MIMEKKTNKIIILICVTILSCYLINGLYYLRPILHSTVKKEIRSLMETTKQDIIEIDIQKLFSKNIDSLVLAGEFFTMDSSILNNILGLCNYHLYSPQDDEYMLILFSGGKIVYDELFYKSEYTFIAPINQSIFSSVLLVKKVTSVTQSCELNEMEIADVEYLQKSPS